MEPLLRSNERHEHIVTSILPFIRKTSPNAVFEPEVTRAMSLAFDEICERLAITPTSEAAREVVAHRVLEFAGKGERDPNRLRDAVLKSIGVPSRVTGL
jgi:hypothetical protein